MHCRLKEPKRSCWTCEVISHRYDPQRNEEEERSDRLKLKVHPPRLHRRLYEPGYVRSRHLANDNRSLYWRSLLGCFWNCSMTLCHRVPGQNSQTGVSAKLTSSLVGNVIVYSCFLTLIRRVLPKHNAQRPSKERRDWTLDKNINRTESTIKLQNCVHIYIHNLMIVLSEKCFLCIGRFFIRG